MGLSKSLLVRAINGLRARIVDPLLLAQPLYFNATQNLTDSGNEVWTATSSGTASTAHGRAVGALPASSGGWIEAQFPAGGDASFMLCFHTLNTANLAHGVAAYCMQVSASGLVNQSQASPTKNSTGYTLPAGPNSRARLKRTGNTFTAETSTDNGATWTVRHTYSNTSSALQYAHLYTTYSTTPFRLYQPRQFGVSAGITNGIQGQWVAPNLTQVGSTVYAGSAGNIGEFKVSRINSDGIIHTSILEDNEADDHNVPAILELLSGKMLVCYARHSLVAEFYNHVSASVNAADWGSKRTVVTGDGAGDGTSDDTATYMQVHRVGGQARVFVMYRIGASDEGDWVIRYSDDEGATWSAEVVLAQNTYITSVTAPDGFTLRCYAYDHPVIAADHDVYHFLVNLTTGDVTNSAGTVFGNFLTPTGLPITKAEQHKAIDLSGSTSIRMYEGGKVGAPAIMAGEFTDALQSTYARYSYSTTTGLFTKSDVCTSGPAFYEASSNYFGGACFGESLNEVYACRNLGASVGVGSWELSRWVYNGSTWTKDSVLRTSANILARPQYKAGRLWWSEISAYSSYTSFAANLFSVPV